MTLFIGKDLAGRLVNRFLLRLVAPTPSSWALQPTIQPVSNADRLFTNQSLVMLPDVQITGTGLYEVLTVPLGKLRHLFTLEANRGANFTLSAINLGKGTTRYVLLKAAAAGSTSLNLFPTDIPGGLWLRGDMKVLVNIDAFTTAGPLSVNASYEDEDDF